MKRITERIGFIAIILFSIFATFKITGWFVRRQVQPAETVYKSDTLYITKWKEKLNIIEKIKWRTVPPETIQVVKYEPWMDSIWCAMRIEKQGDRLSVVQKKDTQIEKHTFRGIKGDFILFGIPRGMIVKQTRFGNPFHWTGVLLGGQYDMDNIAPYFETGLSISRLTILLGATNQKVYIKGQYRIF